MGASMTMQKALEVGSTEQLVIFLIYGLYEPEVEPQTHTSFTRNADVGSLQYNCFSENDAITVPAEQQHSENKYEPLFRHETTPRE